MADAALPPPPSPPAPLETPPAAPSTVRMLAPNNVVYSVDGAQAKLYEQHGYTRYEGPSIDEGGIEQKFGAWRKSIGPTLGAAGLGAVNQVPFLDVALDKYAPDAAKSLAQTTAEARAEHPYAYGAGSVTGAAGIQLAGGALAKVGAGALGLAAKFPNLAALAESSPLVRGAVVGAASNAGLNVADQLDAAALEHALSPEGQEKLVFSLPQLAGATAIGAALPPAFGALPAVLGRGARAAQGAATRRLVRDFIDDEGQQALRDVGKGHVVDGILRDLVDRGQGSGEVVKNLADRVHVLADRQENFLAGAAEGGGGVRDHSLNIEEARSVLARARSVNTTAPVAEDDLRPLANAVASHDAAQAAQHGVRRAEQRLAQERGLNVPGRIEAAERLVAEARQAAQAAQAGAERLPRDRELHDIAQALYKRVNFGAPTASENYPQYRQMGEIIAQGRDTIHQRVAPSRAAAFAQNRAELSDHLALLERIGKKHIDDVRLALDRGRSSATLGAALAAVGARAGNPLSSAAQAGSWAILHQSGARQVAALSNRLAGFFTRADAHLSGIIKAGLYATALPRVAMHKYDYENTAAQVLAAQRDPTTAYGNIHQGLLNKGIPEPVADRLAGRLHAIPQAAARTLPKPQNTPDIASGVQPDTHQRRAWVSEYRSRLDPGYALTFPTAQNMAAAKEHHPQTIMRAQEAVMDELAKNPYLPIASRMWAARVLGRPAGGLTSPKFYQSLSQMRAKAEGEAQAQQGAGGPPRQRGNAPSPVAQSEQSRLGELSTR